VATFQAKVFQNEYLAEGATDVHAVTSVTCEGAGVAGQSGSTEAAEILIIDTSGSMDMPTSKIQAARRAASVALGEIVDGTWFAVVSGNTYATMCYPPQRQLVKMTPVLRSEAIAAVAKLKPTGGTAIGTWLLCAISLFQTKPGAQRHAILLTDGRIEGETPDVLDGALESAAGVFQCDCRGVGSDWEVAQLRRISTALLGTVDIIPNPAEMEADFEAMMKSAMGRGVSTATLRVWAPQGSEILFVREVSPHARDLSASGTKISPLITEYSTGAWGDETRDFHIAVRVPVAPVGGERLAARAEVVVGDEVVAKGLIRAVWTADSNLTTRIDPAVAHYTGQVRLAEAIQQGLAARAEGNERDATVLLGEAAKLAAQSGNEATTKLLQKVIDVVDAETGTVRLRRDVDKADEMALDTRSTKTTRIRKEPTP
jgi:von Willebrand factor type A C-terminal domain/von Willebrand factor type A domain